MALANPPPPLLGTKTKRAKGALRCPSPTGRRSETRCWPTGRPASRGPRSWCCAATATWRASSAAWRSWNVSAEAHCCGLACRRCGGCPLLPPCEPALCCCLLHGPSARGASGVLRRAVQRQGAVSFHFPERQAVHRRVPRGHRQGHAGALPLGPGAAGALELPALGGPGAEGGLRQKGERWGWWAAWLGVGMGAGWDLLLYPPPGRCTCVGRYRPRSAAGAEGRLVPDTGGEGVHADYL